MKGNSTPSAENEGVGCTVGPPDLSKLVSDYFWRVNTDTGYREHVRRKDNLIVTREKLMPAELQKSVSQPKQEKIMTEQLAAATGEPETQPVKGSQLTIIGEPFKLGKRKAVPVRCSCGSELNVDFSNLKLGNVKSCGHLRRGSGKNGAQKKAKRKPETAATETAEVQPLRSKRAYTRKRITTQPEKRAA
ncbi:MAG: hypothetical protein WBV94_24840 [Blastocatellia bacterium]